MNVTIFGTGYVGLVQAAVLAEVGHQVLCVDVDAAKIANLESGIIPIYEPGLEALVTECTANSNLQFTTDAQRGVAHGDVQFIAVGTPPDEDGSADLKYVLAVANTIGQHMETAKVIITKSTVPVGTGDKVEKAVQQALAKRDISMTFEVVSNPEFLKEGAAVKDCQRPDRIIIGTSSAWAEKQMRELYAAFNRNHDKMIVMDRRSAELTKYAANCMLATKISFMNEMANLAEKLGADIEHVRQGIGSDQRIGYHFIYPGCGYGGSCFPKDVQALIRTADGIGYDASLLKSVEQVNYRQKHVLFQRLQTIFPDLAGRRIAVWGLSFKPETDDMREASSRVLMENLWKHGAIVQAYDPEAMAETTRIYGERDDLILCDNKEAALSNADALVIVTEWKTFRSPDFALIKQALKQPVIIDGRNLFDPATLREKGFLYYAIGRGESIALSALIN